MDSDRAADPPGLLPAQPAPTPPGGSAREPVFICEVRHEWTTTEWICQLHIDELRAVRGPTGLSPWQIDKRRVLGPLDAFEVIDGDCAFCDRARQLAPGYVTPTVDFVPTRA